MSTAPITGPGRISVSMIPISRIEAARIGLRFFCTGRPCKRGHHAARRVSNRSCVVCAAEGQQERLAANPEPHKRLVREWAKRNPDKMRAASRRHYRQHLEKEKERQRLVKAAAYAANPDRMRKQSRESYWRHREKRLEYLRAYQKTEAGRLADKASKHRRRAQKSGGGGSVPAALIRRLHAAAKICPDCGKRYSKTRPKHLDHVKPLAAGGAHSIDNLRIVCGTCNDKKHAGRFTSSGQGILI